MGTKTRRILLEDIKAFFKFVVKVIILSEEVMCIKRSVPARCPVYQRGRTGGRQPNPEGAELTRMDCEFCCLGRRGASSGNHSAGWLLILIPVHIGQAPEEGGLAHLLGKSLPIRHTGHVRVVVCVVAHGMPSWPNPSPRFSGDLQWPMLHG